MFLTRSDKFDPQNVVGERFYSTRVNVSNTYNFVNLEVGQPQPKRRRGQQVCIGPQLFQDPGELCTIERSYAILVPCSHTC